MLPTKHALRSAQEFLLRLFRDAPKGSWVEFRGKKSPHCEISGAPGLISEYCKVENLERSFDLSIADWVLDNNRQGYEIWFGAAPRAKTPTGRGRMGKDEDVEVATAAWVDIDKSQEFWEAMIEQDDIPASVFIASGKGLHLYFFYPQPKPIKDVKKDCEDLAERWGGDKVVSNPARVMRLPGTYNWKHHGILESPQCELLSMDVDAVWEGQIPIDTATFKDIGWDLRTVVLGGHEAAAETKYAAKDDTKEVDRSAIDFKVMVGLLVAGFSEDQIREIFYDPNNGISAKMLEEKERHNDENYFQRTFRKAVGTAEVESLRRDEVGSVLVFETAKDIINAPPLRFAVERILPAGGMCFLSGESKSGKSLLVTDLMLLLSGVEGEFMDQFRVNLPGPVCYMQAEVSRGSLKFRLDTVAASRESLWERFPLHFYNGRLDFGQPKHARILREALERKKMSYLIVDPLARFHRKNENRVDEMSAILENIEWAAREAGLMGTVIVHHHNKPNDSNKGSHGARIRGSSVIMDWGNAHVMVAKKFRDTVSRRKYITAHFELRDAEEPEPIDLSLNTETLRFHPFSDDDDKLGLALEVVSANPEGSKEELIDDIQEKTGGGKVKAERLLKRARRIADGEKPGNKNEAESSEPEIDELAGLEIEEP